MDKCYYCGKKATKVIKWSRNKVFSCDECSKIATGKVEEIKKPNDNLK